MIARPVSIPWISAGSRILPMFITLCLCLNSLSDRYGRGSGRMSPSGVR